jgi:hypothetical protein
MGPQGLVGRPLASRYVRRGGLHRQTTSVATGHARSAGNPCGPGAWAARCQEVGVQNSLSGFVESKRLYSSSRVDGLQEVCSQQGLRDLWFAGAANGGSLCGWRSPPVQEACTHVKRRIFQREGKWRQEASQGRVISVGRKVADGKAGSGIPRGFTEHSLSLREPWVSGPAPYSHWPPALPPF